LAQSFDVKVFFTVVGKPPLEIGTADVLRFIEAQRSRGDPKVVRLVDGESGLAASTIERRLATVSGLFDYLAAGHQKRSPRTNTSPLRSSSGRWSPPPTAGRRSPGAPRCSGSIR